MFRAISRFGSSTLQHAALLCVNIAVGTVIIGLVALTLVDQFKPTPEIKSLMCMVGVMRPDCPQYEQELQKLNSDNKDLEAQKKRLNAEKRTIERERDKIEARMTGLKAIQHSIDQVTLFKEANDPNSKLEVTIGTVYRDFTAHSPKPLRYFCYISLGHSAGGLSQYLDIRTIEGWADVSKAKLRKAGVSPQTFKFAKSVCKPYLIGSNS